MGGHRHRWCGGAHSRVVGEAAQGFSGEQRLAMSAPGRYDTANLFIRTDARRSLRSSIQAEGVQLVVRCPTPKLLYPEPQYTMPLEMAAPERQEPPLANSHRTSPVAPFRAYMKPDGSSEQPNMIPFAVVAGPDAAPPWGGAVC